MRGHTRGILNFIMCLFKQISNTGALRLFYDTPTRLSLSTCRSSATATADQVQFHMENQQRLAAAKAMPGGECTAHRRKN